MATENVYTMSFARDDVVKNVPTNTPAILRRSLAVYMKSIGQISCGSIQATCWLVTDMLVITNHHVYTCINTELKNVNLPITVTFDFLYPGQTEHLVTVEVDEEHDPQLESPYLNYKFLRLKEKDGLRNRVPLGLIVRCRPVQEGKVIIYGHPVGKEMQEDICIVHSNHCWLETLKQRHLACSGVRMTHAEVRMSAESYEHFLPYDTSLFHGSSGSPVFDLKGNIVAMHTRGHVLNVQGASCSLMEFGVQFSAICKDMRRRYGNVVEQLFPNFDEPTDIDEGEFPSSNIKSRNRVIIIMLAFRLCALQNLSSI